MLVVIIGGSGSGKSEFAENTAVKLRKNRLIYAAAMMPYGQEGETRIKRHRKARKDKGFITGEKYTCLKSLDGQEVDTVLLECMSNLLANEMFDKYGSGANSVSEIIKGVDIIENRVENLITVTNDILSDGEKHASETVMYIKPPIPIGMNVSKHCLADLNYL